MGCEGAGGDRGGERKGGAPAFNTEEGSVELLCGTMSIKKNKIEVPPENKT